MMRSLLAFGLLCVAAQSNFSAAPESSEISVTQRGAAHRVIEFSTTSADPRTSEPVRLTSRYMERADGLHYWDGNDWQESQDLIEGSEDHFVAQHGPCKALFGENIYGPDALDLTGPDGTRLRSRPRTITYFDRVSGKMIALADVKNCAAAYDPPNRLTYQDALDNLSGSVCYVYRKNGVAQNLILRERPPAPEEFGLHRESTSLQLWTEFIDPPTPTVRRVAFPFLTKTPAGEDSIADEQLLDFGDLLVPSGKAFALHRASADSSKSALTASAGLRDGDAPMANRWITTSAGRQYLVQSVNYEDVAPLLESLPVPTRDVAHSRAHQHKTSSINYKTARAIHNENGYSGQGLVLQYSTLFGFEKDSLTFESKATYYISDRVTVLPEATFQCGSTLKYSDQASLLLYAAPSFPATGPMVTFTSKDDDQVGAFLPNSTHIPRYSGVFINLYHLPQSAAVRNAIFRHGETAVENHGLAARNMISDCFVEKSRTGFYNHGALLSLANTHQCLVERNTAGHGIIDGQTEPDCVGMENTWPGDMGWLLLSSNSTPVTPGWPETDTSTAPEIEGFASLTSVNAGSAISLYVDVRNGDPFYQLEFYRMGWYGGVGARKMAWYDSEAGTSISAKIRTSCKQAIPRIDSATGKIDCLAEIVNGTPQQPWTNRYDLNVPDDWLSGVYLAKLTTLPGAGIGKASYIIFTVREDDRPSDIYFQSSVATWQAYNPWGGKSLYDYPAAPAVTVSFNRPYAGQKKNRSFTYGSGAGEFLTAIGASPMPSWEYNALRWMEKQGYDITYGTSVDTYGGALTNKPIKTWISAGHDEYWSREMRQAVTAARDRADAPLNLVFLGANCCFRRIEFDTNDLIPKAFSCDKRERTSLWRSASHESSLLGTEYMFNSLSTNMTIPAGRSGWVYSYSSASNATQVTVLTNLLGYEIDGVWTFPSQPICAPRPYSEVRPDVFAVAETEFMVEWHDCPKPGDKQNANGLSQMTLYTNSTSGAKIFATGSMQWSWGLDDFGYSWPLGRPSNTNGVAQQIMHNVIRTFTEKPLEPVF